MEDTLAMSLINLPEVAEAGMHLVEQYTPHLLALGGALTLYSGSVLAFGRREPRAVGSKGDQDGNIIGFGGGAAYDRFRS